jgi:hypothetical protein
MDLSEAIREKLKSSKPSMKSSMPSSPKPEMEEMEEDDDAGLMSAAEEMMSAVQSQDSASFVEALKSFLDQYVG